MATKDNFNKAVFDMFGVGSNPDAPRSQQAPQPPVQPAAPVAQPAAPVHSPVTVREEAPAPKPPVTYIAPGSYMEGTLKVKGDVEVAGDFKGEMSASGNVVVHSSICSGITAAKVNLVSCKLTGNIHASGVVTVDAKSAVVGNVYAAELICAGSVQGDIQITGNATFQQNSKVDGNITTGTMTMERGAVISGNLTMNGPAPEKKVTTSDGTVVHAVH